MKVLLSVFTLMFFISCSCGIDECGYDSGRECNPDVVRQIMETCRAKNMGVKGMENTKNKRITSFTCDPLKNGSDNSPETTKENTPNEKEHNLLKGPVFSDE